MSRIKHSPKTLISVAFLIVVIALACPQSTFGQKSGSQPAASPTSNSTASPTTSAPQNVNVVNTPAVTLAPGASVSVSGTPSVTVSGTPNVAISGTPTVSLAPGTSVSVSGTPSVTVAGTPSVTVSGTPNVAISGTPTVNVAPAETVLAYDQTVTVLQFGGASLPQLDVSMFKEIRIVFTVNGAIDYILASRIVNPNDATEVVVLENLNQAQTGRGTKTYDIPGQRIDFVLNGSNFGPASVHVQIFGRSN